MHWLLAECMSPSLLRPTHPAGCPRSTFRYHSPGFWPIGTEVPRHSQRRLPSRSLFRHWHHIGVGLEWSFGNSRRRNVNNQGYHASGHYNNIDRKCGSAYALQEPYTCVNTWMFSGQIPKKSVNNGRRDQSNKDFLR